MPRTTNNVYEEKLRKADVDRIVEWYEHLIDPNGGLRTDYVRERKADFESYLVDVPAVYYEMIDRAFLAEPTARKKPSDFLILDEYRATQVDYETELFLKDGQITEFFYQLSQGTYEVKDAERAMDYYFYSEFLPDVEEIHSENIDRDKLEYLKNKRRQEEALKEYLEEMKNSDPEKADYLKKESALWKKENEKLDQVTVALFDAKHQSKTLRQKQESDPRAFTKADQKALEKADKAQRDLEKRFEKLRDAMQKDYDKRLKKNPCPYADVAANRRAQIAFGSLDYLSVEAIHDGMNTVETVSETVRMQVNFTEELAKRGVDAKQYTAQQTPMTKQEPRQTAEEKEAPARDLP